MNRRLVNTIRAELSAIKAHPDANNVLLPPQPSILSSQPEPLMIRYAHRLNRISYRLGPVRHQLSKVRSFTKQQSVKKQLSDISFDQTTTPTVSIVIPVFNKLDLTRACLISLQNNVSKDIAYEVVIVDNNSTDKSNYLSKVTGLKYIRNAVNLGFVEACNIGASISSGEYLVFLNNDALVTPGWLESLLKTIQSSPKIGLVGSKILYPDGRLQEAGGMIFSDGSGWNYGKNDHPDRYQYNYVREVDYCSGASIIIAKELFDSFGGFDMFYAPAYYEDTDLAFKVRNHGLKVIYQPESVIYHIEGATAGVSTTNGFKKYQAINKDKFLQRWKKDLRSNHVKPKDWYLERDRTGSKMVLISDEFLPKPDIDAGSARAAKIIELFQELGYKVTFFPNHLQKVQGGYTEMFQQMGVEVVYGPTSFSEFIEAFGKYYDVVVLSRPRIGSYFIDLCEAYCTKAKIIYDTVDLHYLRLGRQAKFEKGKMKNYLEDMAQKHEIIEKDLMQTADATLVVSNVEADMLKKDGIENVQVLSTIHTVNDSAYGMKFDDRRDLLFVGGYSHTPNLDGVKWFVDDIFPLVLKVIPDIKIHLVGAGATPEIKKFLSKRQGVIVEGFVENLSPLLNTSRVFVAPLRFGAGVKGKIGQAIESGIPVVSTGIGAEGMHLKNNSSVIIADSPQAFADSIIELYSNEEKWNTIRLGAKKVITKYFSMNTAKEALLEIVNK